MTLSLDPLLPLKCYTVGRGCHPFFYEVSRILPPSFLLQSPPRSFYLLFSSGMVVQVPWCNDTLTLHCLVTRAAVRMDVHFPGRS